MSDVPLLPDYELLRRIGSGAYGEVWLGRTLTGVYRAVKILRRDRFPDERPYLRELDGITRFQSAMMHRPRQLALLHVGRSPNDDYFYYVMELADDATSGSDIVPERYVPLTLREKRGRADLALSEALGIGIELTRALVELHGAGLIHRDVKPSNIIFVNGAPKLADIGLVSSSDHTLASFGTPGYAPPEGASSAQADIYSLGRILYELATGLDVSQFPRLPSDVIERRDRRELLELNEVLLKACAINPQQRYASAQAMLDDLLLLQAGKSVQQMARLQRVAQRYARVASAAALLACAALALTFYRGQQAARSLADQEAQARQSAEAAEKLARYSADLEVAHLGWRENEYGLTRAALRRQDPAMRGPEWHALWNLTKGDQTRIFGEVGQSGVRRALTTGDGRWIVLSLSSGVLQLIDRRDGVARDLGSRVYSIAGFGPNESEVIVGTDDRQVQRIALTSGERSAPQSARGRIIGVAQGGRQVLLGDKDEQQLRFTAWDAVAETSVAEWRVERPNSRLSLLAAALSEDGRLLAYCFSFAEGAFRRSRLEIVDLRNQTVIAGTDQLERVLVLCFSPDASVIAAGGFSAPTLILETSTAQPRFTVPAQRGAVDAIAFSQDGQRLFTAGRDTEIRVWHLRPEGPVLERALRGHEGRITALDWSDQESHLLSASEDGTARTWDLGTLISEPVIRPLWARTLGDVLFSPDGKDVVVTDANGHLSVFDVARKTRQRVLRTGFHPLYFRDEGKTLVALTMDRALAQIAFSDGGPVKKPVELGLDDRVPIEALSSHAEVGRLAVYLQNGDIRVWDANNGKLFPVARGHDVRGNTVSLSASGNRVASLSHTGELLVTEVESGREVRRERDEAWKGGRVWFGRTDDVLLIGRAGGELESLEVKSGLREKWAAHTRGLSALTVSIPGRWLTGGEDGLILWWSERMTRIATLALPREIAGHKIDKLSVDPKGQTLAVFTTEGDLALYSVQAPQ